MSWSGIRILLDNYNPGIVPPVFSETDLLPAAASLSTIATVLQQKGRGRTRIKGKAFFSDMSDYESLITDYYAGTTGSLDDASGTYMIESMGEPEYKQADVIFCEVTWVEVTSS